MSMSLPVDERQRRFEEVVADYLEAVEAGRAEGLEVLLERHPDLAEEIAAFFAHQDEVARLAGPFRELAAGPSLAEPGDARRFASPGDALPPSGMLGDFRIVREVGRGGMGIVYEAEQLSLQRRVALKVLPFAATMDARQLRRFQNEARAAAGLHHTNIVPVYSVGSERGVYYYAMQFIDGRDLASVLAKLRARSGRKIPEPQTAKTAAGCRSAVASPPPGPAADTRLVAGLSTVDSRRPQKYFQSVARLGIQAAEALDHAHQQGVVHRDVKPANLLVDADLRLWIADFGLAHIHSDARLTMSGDLVGTLRYMSPEQALAKGVVVDHRSDIYSLGATLYELLTLEPAFRGKDRQELLRQIATEDPVRPRRVNKAIPVELETIVGKAMEKDPADRYATAQEVADDLRSFREHRPIQARRPSWRQRGVKWVRRHQAVVITAALGFLVAIATLGGAVGWVMGDRAARQGEAERAVSGALENARRLLQDHKWAEALAAARRAEGLAESDVGLAMVRHKVQEVLVDLKMVKTVEEIRMGQALFKGDLFELLQADVAYAKAFRDYGIDVDAWGVREAGAKLGSRIIRVQLAEALDDWAAGRMIKKQPSYKHLVAVARAADPDEWRSRVREAVERGNIKELRELEASPGLDKVPPSMWLLLGRALRVVGGDEAGVSLLRKAQQRHPGDFWINLDLAWVLTNMRRPRLEEAVGFYRVALALRPDSPLVYWTYGVALEDKGETDEAITCYRQAIRLKPDYAEPHRHLGHALMTKGALDESIAHYKEAIRLKPLQPEIAYTLLANALTAKGALEEAKACYREAIRLKADVAMVHHNRAIALLKRGALDEAISWFQEAIRLKPDFADAHNNLGVALTRKGAPAEAIACYKEAIRLEPDQPEFHHNLGVVLMKKGALAEALKLHEETLALRKAKLGPDHPDTLRSMNNLANSYAALGRHGEAVKLHEKTLALRKAKLGADHPSTLLSMINLARSYAALGRHAEALKLREQTLALRKAKLGPDHPDTFQSMYYLANSYADGGRHAEALKLREQTLALQKAKLGPNHADTLASMHNLGLSYAALGRYADALKLYEETLALRKARLGPDHPATLWSMNNLANCYAALGRYADALKLHEETLALRKAKLGPHHADTMISMQCLAELYQASGQVAKAEPLWRELAATRKKVNGANDPATAGALAQLGMNLLQLRKFDEAEPVLRDCLTIRERIQPALWSTFNTKAMLGGSLLGQKKYAEAEPLLLQGYEGMKARGNIIPPQGRPPLTEALEGLVQLYDALGAREKAAGWRKQLAAAKWADTLWQDLLTGQGTPYRFLETRQEGVVTAAKGKQVHPLEMKAGKTYVLDLESKAFDTMLILEDGAGVPLAENDDISPSNLNSRIIFTAPKTASYRILATAYTTGSTGAYVVRIRELVEENEPLKSGR